MEVLGFFYERAEEKIPANGRPISRELTSKGYVQKNNTDGVPSYYVKPCKVWLYVEINGTRRKFNIAGNILAIHPERQKLSLKLAQDTVVDILNGDIDVTLKNGSPFLRKWQRNKNKHGNKNF